MKIDTKKCSPIRVGSTPITAASRLDDDVILMHPNKYIVDHGYDEKCGDESDDNDNHDVAEYGRKVQHLPKLVYTPVKVSSRKSLDSGRNTLSSYQKKRAVTDSEMDELNSGLSNLYVVDDEETKEEDGNDNHDTEDEEEHKSDTDGSSSSSSKKNSDNNDSDECYNRDKDGNLIGRIPQYHFDSKTGKKSTVLRSARFTKKKVILDL